MQISLNHYEDLQLSRWRKFWKYAMYFIFPRLHKFSIDKIGRTKFENQSVRTFSKTFRPCYASPRAVEDILYKEPNQNPVK